MSFESFRAGMISRLSPVLPEDHLQEVLRALDEMGTSWEFSPKSTAIITAGGVPDEVRNYLACKSIENIKKSTLQNYFYLLRLFFNVVRLPVDRITAASLALQRGMPIDQVQKWLGHAKIQTTLRYAKTLNFDVKLSHQKYCA